MRATPAMALGSYDATPLDMASAYTVFANGGQKIAPILINSVRDTKGEVVANYSPERKSILDPRTVAVMTDMLQAVINSGLGSGVRARGFTPPAAGKTGRSHDGWFAGYTSNLLCIVWVGYDDYSDLHLAGAQTAVPIWTAFMKRAVTLPQYSNTSGFGTPAGVVSVQLDKNTNRLATPSCPETYTTSFVEGTEPKETCDQPATQPGFFSKIFGTNESTVLPPGTEKADHLAQKPDERDEKKKGVLGKIVGFLKGDKAQAPAPVKPNGQPPQ